MDKRVVHCSQIPSPMFLVTQNITKKQFFMQIHHENTLHIFSQESHEIFTVP